MACRRFSKKAYHKSNNLVTTYIYNSYFIILCLFIAQQNVFGQSVRSFTYGGSSGSRNGGKVTMQYFLQNGGRLQKLESNTIDLNSYGSSVRLIVQFSNLEVGLKPSGTGMKNKGHYNQYYLEASHQKSGLLGSPKGQAIQITAEGGYYGELLGKLVYKIGAITSESTAYVKIKTEIISNKNGRRWNAIPITKKFTLIPRTSDIAKSRWRPIKKLWEEVNEKATETNKKLLLEKCIEYRKNCEEGAFSCYNGEDVLYYMISLTDGDARKELVREYKETYRRGKYLEEISRTPEVLEPEIPIEPGARLDSDDHYLVINGIKGGKRPYRALLFDYNKNKEYAMESVRFNEEDFSFPYASMKIPKGFYTIKVIDKKGNVFVEKEQVHVNKAFRWPPSIKLIGLLLIMGGMAFAYKKLIHF